MLLVLLAKTDNLSSTDSRTDNLAHAIEVMIERIIGAEGSAESASASADEAKDVAGSAKSVAEEARKEAKNALKTYCFQ